MDLATIVAVLLPLAFIIYWVTDLIKDVTNKDKNAVLTKIVAWVGAFIVISAYAHSSINLGETAGNARDALNNLGWVDLGLLATAVAAGGGSFSDFLRAKNNADPSVKSKLLP